MLVLSWILTASACRWWLWLSERNSGFSRPLPQIRQGLAQLLPLVGLQATSLLSPLLTEPLRRGVPQYKADCITALLLVSVAYVRELDFDQHSGPSLPAPASPWTPTEPRPFVYLISLGPGQGALQYFLALHILFPSIGMHYSLVLPAPSSAQDSVQMCVHLR